MKKSWNQERLDECLEEAARAYQEVRKLASNPLSVLGGAIRKALESAIQLYWVYNWDERPYGTNLFGQINELKNNKAFNSIIISHMHNIRSHGNKAVHNMPLEEWDETDSLLNILQECIKAISEKTGCDIIEKQKELDDIEKQKILAEAEPLLEIRKIEKKEQNTKEIVEEKRIKETKEIVEEKQITQTNIMTKAETIYKDFWKIFEEVLEENGMPFQIVHEMSGKSKSWANVNKKHIFNKNAVDISLRSREKRLRLGLYVVDKNCELGRVLFANKANIDKKLPFEHNWENGSRNVNTLRITTYLSFSHLTYREVIEQALPILVEYISIADEYGSGYFFDF